MECTWLKVLLIAGTIDLGCLGNSVGRQSFGGRERWEPPPKREDYEAKVMIFHQPEPRLNLLEPKKPDADGVVRHSTMNDVVGHIVKGLLRHRMTPREREAHDDKVNAQRLEEYHKMNARKQKEKAEEEEMRRLHREQMREEAILQQKQMRRQQQPAQAGRFQQGNTRMEQQFQSSSGSGAGRRAHGREEFALQEERKWDRRSQGAEFQQKSINNQYNQNQFADSSARSNNNNSNYGAMRSNRNFWNKRQEEEIAGGPSVKISIPYEDNQEQLRVPIDNQEQLRVPIQQRQESGISRSSSFTGNYPQRNPPGIQNSAGGMRMDESNRNSATRKEIMKTSSNQRVPGNPQELPPRVALTRSGPSSPILTVPFQQQQQQQQMRQPASVQMQKQSQQQSSSYSEDLRRRNNQQMRPPPQHSMSISEDSVEKIMRKSSPPKGNGNRGQIQNPNMKPAPLPRQPQIPSTIQRNQQSVSTYANNNNNRRQENQVKKTSMRNNNKLSQPPPSPPKASLEMKRMSGNNGQYQQQQKSFQSRQQQQSSNLKAQQQQQRIQLPPSRTGGEEIRRRQEDLRVSVSEQDVIVGPQALVQPQVNHQVAPDVPPIRIPAPSKTTGSRPRPPPPPVYPNNNPNRKNMKNRQNARRGPQQQ